jgi:hypothetical protein
MILSFNEIVKMIVITAQESHTYPLLKEVQSIENMLI